MSTRETTTEIIIHCSATPPDMDIGAEEIDQWHRQRGWKGIGYHFVIRRDGRVETGRGVDEVGAHAKGHNAFSIGVCLVGGVNEALGSDNNFTLDQCNSLEETLENLCIAYPTAKVIGHNEVSNKDCPSFDVQDWLDATGLLSEFPSGADACPACGQPLI